MTSPPGPGESAAVPAVVPAAADGEDRKAVARSRYRDALRHRDMRVLIGTFLVDQVGSWSFVVVIVVYVFDRTHSTQWLAATSHLPSLTRLRMRFSIAGLCFCTMA